MIESIEENIPLLSNLIQHTIQQLPPRREIERGSNEETQLAQEIDVLFADRDVAMQALKLLFPEGIPTDSLFFTRLNDLHMRLGWGQLSHRFTGLLLLVAVDNLSQESSEAMLRELPAIKDHRFFQALECLAILFDERELRPLFAREWLPAIVRRIGNDLAPTGFWKALTIYCEKRTESALEILQCLFDTHDESEIAVAAYILGTLRTIKKNEAVSAVFNQVEGRFVDAEITNARLVHHRSWLQTAQRGCLTPGDFECLTDRIKLEIGDARDQFFWIVCRIMCLPNLSPECFRLGLDWLVKNVSPALSSAAKFSVIDFAAQLSDEGKWDGTDLILALQPIPAEDRGTWGRFEAFLVRRLETDVQAFNDIALKLAERDGRGWLSVMQEPRSLEWLLLEMQKRDLGALVGKLLLSLSSACRKLGLFFFHKLGSSIPRSLFESANEDQLRVLFYEHQRSSVFGEATARLLIFLIPEVERQDQEFQDEFSKELLFQAKNYAGACRDAFKEKSGDYPILKKALAEAEEYFDAIRGLQQSSIAAMDVPGYSDARRLYDRRFAEDISKGSEKASVFAQFTKKVHLLYARQWSFFRDRKLSQPSQVKGISTSMEVPRFEQIDPEGMVLRRLYASNQIITLTKVLSAENPSA